MKKIVSAILVVLMLASMAVVMTSCSEEAAPAKKEDVALGEIGENLVAEKVGNINRDSFMTAEGGLYYKDESGKYGVMSIEGRYDTGAIYATCLSDDAYFKVSKVQAKNYTDIPGLNSIGLINGKGQTLVPFGYADIKLISERFAQVFTVTGPTASEETAVKSYNEYDTISLTPATSELFFKGKWEIYDMEVGKLIPGVSGTTKEYPFNRGNFITYSTDAGFVTIDPTGAVIPDTISEFDDGSYAIEGKIGDVYDTNGNKLFSYDLTGYTPSAVYGDYYVASLYADGESKYAVMDKKGTILSDNYVDIPEIAGKLLLSDGKVYDLEGNNVYEGTFDSLQVDSLFGSCYMLRADDTYTMIKEDGTALFHDVYTDDVTIYYDEYTAHKKVYDEEGDYDYYCYSHKDKDYTIKGYNFAPWLVKTESTNNLYNVVDTMTGKNLFEGYSNYSTTKTDTGAYYVYAQYNGGADVYLIISSTMLEATTQKKQDLYAELVEAFKKEGLNVTVNTETGEIAMDTSVLFGGDSAELSKDGKTFLNKFIKVYTTIAFSEKYAGFISKTMVEGHTAPLEGSTYASGLQLSEERANVVKTYCLSAETGVDVSEISDALESVGYSNSQPVYAKDGKVDLDASRRVSFRFMVNVTL